MQLKPGLHSQDGACDWTPLRVAAAASGGRALHSSGTMGDVPRDGWRDLLYNFDVPESTDVVRLDLATQTRALESWRIDLDGREVRRVGYAIAGAAEVAFANLSTPTGCARLLRGRLENLWIEQRPRKQLQARAIFTARKDTEEPCAAESRLMLLNSRARASSNARLDSARSVTFTLTLPDGRDRLR